MDEKAFIRKNAACWEALEAECRFFSKRMGRMRNKMHLDRLTKERIDAFLVLYNNAANHLAYVRTNFGETQTAVYLNRLVGTAHGLIYTGSGFRLRNLFAGIAYGIPKLFRRRILFFWIAAALFVLPALFAFLYTAADLRNAYAFLDPATVAGVRGEGMYDPYMEGLAALQSVGIGVNNIQVALGAFAGGITLGLYTGYVLIANGLMLGALAGVYFHMDAGVFFWSLILPHGITELFAIMLSGAAGMMIGAALLNPGKLSRRNALILRGGEACRLAGGVVLLLIPSAFIEGYFTPLALPYAIKYIFSATVLVLLVLYLTLPGRKKRENLQ